MYRSSRASIVAQIGRLEGELERAEAEVAARAEALAPLAVQLCPLFSNFEDTIEPIRRGGHRGEAFWIGVVVCFLVAMSVPVLPIAFLSRYQRRDVRSLAAARRRAEKLGARLDEAKKTLAEL